MPPWRFATFNASLNRSSEGQLVTDLSTPDNEQAQTIAEIVQRSNPDVLLINEFDYDEAHQAADLFRENYLEVSQNGAPPVSYPYAFTAPSNTGIPSGYDLNNDGSVGGPDDALGFGFFPGQYGMVVYSKFPIVTDEVRTFQSFRWQDMPGALLPVDPNTNESWYSPEELEVVRLSSKSHWDLPVEVEGTDHPSAGKPPDAPRIRWARGSQRATQLGRDSLLGGLHHHRGRATTSMMMQGRRAGWPSGASFVVAGDQNSDPLDGDSLPDAINQLLDSPLVNTSMTPTSAGAVEQSALQGGANANHESDPAHDTADFQDTPGPGNLRADYVLPSLTLDIETAEVFWPRSDDPYFYLVGTFPFPSSDHRLVWVDLSLAPTAVELSALTIEDSLPLAQIGVAGAAGPGGARRGVPFPQVAAAAGRGSHPTPAAPRFPRLRPRARPGGPGGFPIQITPRWQESILILLFSCVIFALSHRKAVPLTTIFLRIEVGCHWGQNEKLRGGLTVHMSWIGGFLYQRARSRNSRYPHHSVTPSHTGYSLVAHVKHAILAVQTGGQACFLLPYLFSL